MCVCMCLCVCLLIAVCFASSLSSCTTTTVSTSLVVLIAVASHTAFFGDWSNTLSLHILCMYMAISVQGFYPFICLRLSRVHRALPSGRTVSPLELLLLQVQEAQVWSGRVLLPFRGSSDIAPRLFALRLSIAPWSSARSSVALPPR